MSKKVLSTTDSEFEAVVLQSDVPVLVDFWAEWCGPCKMIAPILDEAADELDGRVKIVKVNVEENSKTPVKYGVKGIPHLILFKDGNDVARKKGALSKPQLMAFIDENC